MDQSWPGPKAVWAEANSMMQRAQRKGVEGLGQYLLTELGALEEERLGRRLTVREQFRLRAGRHYQQVQRSQKRGRRAGR
jgi:hypothetical protein